MPTQMIQTGVPTLMVQNQTYATPSKPFHAHVIPTTGLEASNDGTTWAAISVSGNGVFLASPFVRSTGTTTIITIRTY